MEITARVNVKEVVNGNTKFPSCSAKINGTWFKIKFTQECEKSPKSRGVYNVTFDTRNTSIQRGKKYTNKNGKDGIENDTIWIKKIVSIVKYTEEELAEMNAAEVEKALNGFTAIDTNEELPF